MISDARNGHVSPGIYTNERDVTYSVKSLGITSLGLVGETLYGPAFQNVEITNWAEFVDYFGGTSPIKFKDGTPKYELPYIAKSYLEESKRLNVVRVLGLSGYDAGKEWVIKNDDKPAIVLRSKMRHEDNNNFCTAQATPSEIVETVKIVTYEQKNYTTSCGNSNPLVDTGNTPTIRGKFGLEVSYKNWSFNEKTQQYTSAATAVTYYVSLNPNDSDYIYNVLSNRPDTGTTPIYIESVFENALFSAYTENGKTVIDYSSTFIMANTSGTSNFNDFKSPYRAAQTPWIVSDAIVTESTPKEGETGTTKTASVRKLFRFITISDGNAANFQVKVSIQNIDVENASFDVVIRDFNDSDRNPIILETFRKCNLVEGDANYIAYKIGTADGGYVSKSKYVVVEMADGEDFSNSFPAGFIGYPVPKYGCDKGYEMNYNTRYNPSEKAKRQYFGISNIDTDVLSYKGKFAYEGDNVYITNGFHMDSLLSGATVYVDGESGFSFTSVSTERVGNYPSIPRLINALYIDRTLYSDIKTRKFTVCFYGGFDGWDVNRVRRSNTDEFKSTMFSMENVAGGKVNDGKLSVFDIFSNDSFGNLPLNLPSTAITSDYYAYLAGVRVFANPQDVDINILATPGINWLDNALLTQEIIEVVEDSEDGRGGDALYVMASPNLADADEARNEFEGVDINSSYACTYFPWVMYYDNTNRRYLDLPVTKDIVRNMAATDNKSYPWFAPAGTERGNVNCVKAVFKTTLADEDALYEVGINPVKSFAQDGVKIWGNKTTYSVESPLNRINVRRLMIRVKKLISDAAKHLIFDQYDETLEKQFRGIVEPILADVKANRGIIDYRVITECTPETRDQHILPAKILIKPTQSLEYISISFTVYPESVSFED